MPAERPARRLVESGWKGGGGSWSPSQGHSAVHPGGVVGAVKKRDGVGGVSAWQLACLLPGLTWRQVDRWPLVGHLAIDAEYESVAHGLRLQTPNAQPDSRL